MVAEDYISSDIMSGDYVTSETFKIESDATCFHFDLTYCLKSNKAIISYLNEHEH